MNKKYGNVWHYAAAVSFLSVLIIGSFIYLGYMVSKKMETTISEKIAVMQYASLLSGQREIPSPLPRPTEVFSIKFTPESYRGDFAKTERQTGDKICNSIYPGYHFCTAQVLNLAGGNLPDPIKYSNPFVGGWVNSGQEPRLNCENWQSSSSETKGGRFYANGSTASRWWIISDSDRACDTVLPLCCYR